jgi:hypothetical protein
MLYLLGAGLQVWLVDAALAPLARFFGDPPLWLGALIGLAIGVVNGSVWIAVYQSRTRRYLSLPWEFDCSDCGRHITRFNHYDPRAKCAECLAIPGWWRDPHLVRLFDPLLVGREEEIEPSKTRTWPK